MALAPASGATNGGGVGWTGSIRGGVAALRSGCGAPPGYSAGPHHGGRSPAPGARAEVLRVVERGRPPRRRGARRRGGASRGADAGDREGRALHVRRRRPALVFVW